MYEEKRTATTLHLRAGKIASCREPHYRAPGGGQFFQTKEQINLNKEDEK